jgi:hypothetical protein
MAAAGEISPRWTRATRCAVGGRPEHGIAAGKLPCQCATDVSIICSTQLQWKVLMGERSLLCVRGNGTGREIARCSAWSARMAVVLATF